MHFSTIIVFAMTLILAISVATVSAQAPTDACLRCIISSAKTASPTCDNALLSARASSEGLTPEQKACYCPLSVNDVWVQRCVQPGECLASDAPIIYSTVSDLKHICTAAPPAMKGVASIILGAAAEAGFTVLFSDAGTVASSSSKALTGVSLAVALAAALLM